MLAPQAGIFRMSVVAPLNLSVALIGGLVVCSTNGKVGKCGGEVIKQLKEWVREILSQYFGYFISR